MSTEEHFAKRVSEILFCYEMRCSNTFITITAVNELMQKLVWSEMLLGQCYFNFVASLAFMVH